MAPLYKRNSETSETMIELEPDVPDDQRTRYAKKPNSNTGSKMRWQFSLGRAMVAITVICVALAAARAMFVLGSEVAAGMIAVMGFGYSAGFIARGHRTGGVVCAVALIVFVAIVSVIEMLFM